MLQNMIKRNSYFGTDGIRGIVGEELTPELLVLIGKSLMLLNYKKVFVATDTRESRDLLSHSLIAGALSVGIDVCFIGVVSTPALIYISKKYHALGVMITASHNPFYYNGIKIVKQGYKLLDVEQNKLNCFLQNPYEVQFNLGLYTEDLSMYKQYLSFLEGIAKPTSLKVGIDCASGAIYKMAPELLGSICPNLVAFNDTFTGRDINEGIGATNIDFLRGKVLEHQCDIGFAYDGDADRVIAVDRKGNIIDGDKIIYVLACYLKDKGMLSKNKVVLTVMSNLGIIQALQSKGIGVVEVGVGDRNVYDMLADEDLSIGGEASGHIIIPQLFPSGDGLLVTLLLLNVLEELNISIDSILDSVSFFPHVMRNIPLSEVQVDLEENKELLKLKSEIEGNGKISIRASGTERVLRISVMGRTNEIVDEYMSQIMDCIK